MAAPSPLPLCQSTSREHKRVRADTHSARGRETEKDGISIEDRRGSIPVAHFEADVVTLDPVIVSLLLPMIHLRSWKKGKDEGGSVTKGPTPTPPPWCCHVGTEYSMVAVLALSAAINGLVFILLPLVALSLLV